MTSFLRLPRLPRDKTCDMNLADSTVILSTNAVDRGIIFMPKLPFRCPSVHYPGKARHPLRWLVSPFLTLWPTVSRLCRKREGNGLQIYPTDFFDLATYIHRLYLWLELSGRTQDTQCHQIKISHATGAIKQCPVPAWTIPGSRPTYHQGCKFCSRILHSTKIHLIQNRSHCLLGFRYGGCSSSTPATSLRSCKT